MQWSNYTWGRVGEGGKTASPNLMTNKPKVGVIIGIWSAKLWCLLTYQSQSKEKRHTMTNKHKTELDKVC